MRRLNNRRYGHEAFVEFNKSDGGKIYHKCWEIFYRLVKKDSNFYNKFLVFLETLEKEGDN
jgi:hypothetical protein